MFRADRGDDAGDDRGRDGCACFVAVAAAGPGLRDSRVRGGRERTAHSYAGGADMVLPVRAGAPPVGTGVAGEVVIDTGHRQDTEYVGESGESRTPKIASRCDYNDVFRLGVEHGFFNVFSCRANRKVDNLGAMISAIPDRLGNSTGLGLYFII
ncbi:hypothetical protein KEM60_03294 [Austwickia sp. TVS 96-490-7B]|nr:hypothetical protein [Austwickia sp. TVS 96-490-7B]